LLFKNFFCSVFESSIMARNDQKKRKKKGDPIEKKVLQEPEIMIIGTCEAF